MRAKILYVTDLTYPAPGRRYGDEDAYLASQLRDTFDVALCHPFDATALMDGFDAVVVRNIGPVLQFQAAYDEFRAAALARGTRMFNQLTGRADMLGKQYLVDLSAAGQPVIPTVNSPELIDQLPAASSYIVKPMFGADSIGLQIVPPEALAALSLTEQLVQPLIDLRYEISFYFIDRDFQYALYAPDPSRRWDLERYDPTVEDLTFAKRFVEWNTIDHGIQRVDAGRTPAGDLLLVELEDLNPYLSLDLTDDDTRAAFVTRMAASLTGLLALN